MPNTIKCLIFATGYVTHTASAGLSRLSDMGVALGRLSAFNLSIKLKKGESQVQKKSVGESMSRIPPNHGGIQVNFCKNWNCKNCGAPGAQTIDRGAHRDRYTAVSAGRQYPALKVARLHQALIGVFSDRETETTAQELTDLPASDEQAPVPTHLRNRSTGTRKIRTAV